MIEKKVVDRYAHQSGVKDQLVAEREVVLTYALHALGEAKTLDLLAFKGGTCLRKIVFGSTGRFSEDLDFTLCGDDSQEALTALYEVFNREHHGVAFSLDDAWYETDDGFGMEVQYRHGWNASGKFRLQVSTREKPTLGVSSRAMTEQLYFKDLEFKPFDVPCLEPIEMAAEKVRAAFQRAKVRDLYDLHLLARQKFDGDLLRALVVLKLWQVRDAFDPPGFFTKLRGGAYDWEDLHRLLRPSERVDQETIIAGIELHFRKLKELTELEAHVVADAKKGARNEPLGGRLRAEIRDRYARL
ncbi:MAG: nucleotidyl transferase AbiEii/AbiGii toxin family protein [Polyangiaceae bacterium]